MALENYFRYDEKQDTKKNTKKIYVEKNIKQQKQRGYNPIFEVWLWYQLNESALISFSLFYSKYIF